MEGWQEGPPLLLPLPNTTPLLLTVAVARKTHKIFSINMVAFKSQPMNCVEEGGMGRQS